MPRFAIIEGAHMADTGIDVSALDPERTIVVATGNAHKLVEIEAILSSVMPRVTFVALATTHLSRRWRHSMKHLFLRPLRMIRDCVSMR